MFPLILAKFSSCCFKQLHFIGHSLRNALAKVRGHSSRGLNLIVVSFVSCFVENMNRLHMACSLQHLTWHQCDELWQAVPTCGRGQCPLRCQSRSSHPTWWHDVDTFDRLRHYGMHKHSSKTFGSLGAGWCSCFLPWKIELLLIWQRGKFYHRIFVGGCLTSSAGIMNPYYWYFWYSCCVWAQQLICSLGLSCFNFWCVVMFCVCTFSVSPPLVLMSLHLSPSFASTTLLYLTLK